MTLQTVKLYVLSGAIATPSVFRPQMRRSRVVYRTILLQGLVLHALRPLVLSTDIQIQEKFFLGALASLIHVEGVSVISRLKIASKRALYCFRLSEQCQQCQSYRAND